MKIEAVGTFGYRLLADPSLGNGIGNTVFVGLDADNREGFWRLQFSGMPARIKDIVEALNDARTYDGHLFDTEQPVRIRQLASAMGSNRMRGFVPLLVRGHHFLESIEWE